MIYHIKENEFPTPFWRLMDAALSGETVFIEREDKALLQLVPLKPMLHPRQAGSAKGQIRMADDFDAPLNDWAEYMP